MGEMTAAERYWANHRRAVFFADACTRFGVSPTQVQDYYCNMMAEVTFGSWGFNQSNTTMRYPTNPYTVGATTPRGLVISRTASAGAYGWITPFGNPSAQQVASLILTGNKSWYVAGRFSYQQVNALPVPTTLRAGLAFHTGFNASNPVMVVGIDGGISTSKFAARGDAGGSSCVSTINIDKDVMHDFKCWRTTAGSTILSFDNETNVTGNTYPSVAAGPCIGLYDSAAGSTMGMTWQELYVAVVYAET